MVTLSMCLCRPVRVCVRKRDLRTVGTCFMFSPVCVRHKHVRVYVCVREVRVCVNERAVWGGVKCVWYVCM